MTRLWVELGQGPASNNTNEEREERDVEEEGHLVRASTRPPADEPACDIARGKLASAAPAAPATFVASVASLPHPSRFSVRRQQ